MGGESNGDDIGDAATELPAGEAATELPPGSPLTQGSDDTVRAPGESMKLPAGSGRVASEEPVVRARSERVAQLSHPNIVTRTAKLVGRTFAVAVAETKSLADRLALLPHLCDAADALAHAHEQRIVHRELDATRVVIGDRGETAVIGWHRAVDLDAGATTDDERTDVYALGELLYQLIAGMPPGAPAVPVGEVEPHAPAELVAIVDRAMAPALADRYPNARELATELRRSGDVRAAASKVMWGVALIAIAAIVVIVVLVL